MKLDYRYPEIEAILGGTPSEDPVVIRSIAFDTRRILDGSSVLFFALEGVFRNGHDFIPDAYDKGVRRFVVSQAGSTSQFPDALEIVVPDTLKALQELAAWHRKRFSIPVVGITGSNGKTTVKEWLSTLLQKKFNVARTPKSYNSQLGVAISLLELTAESEVAVIEAGISEPGEMHILRHMIAPTHGIFTSFGAAHRENFASRSAHLAEKLALFQDLDHFLIASGIQEHSDSRAQSVDPALIEKWHDKVPFRENVQKENALLAIGMAEILGLTDPEIEAGLHELYPLTMRLESYNGVEGNTIINDTYSLDSDSLRLSLEYQLAHSAGKQRIAVIGLATPDTAREQEIRKIVSGFDPVELYFYYPGHPFEHQFTNKSILFKGMRNARMEQLATRFKQQHHQTYLEIDLSAIRHNINVHKQLLRENTRLLCMVKASSYGSDARTIGRFLENMGVSYLGVAYADEGIELRNSGVGLPILVMNAEESTFSRCIEYRLEPAFFSLRQLNAFTEELISRGEHNYPIHIKLETGMNRLGFTSDQLSKMVSFVKAQPEIYIRSVYSHLAESDVPDSDFTRRQIEQFTLMADQLENEFAHPFLRHILNSSGIRNYPEAQFDMVRLGIGMYGAVSDPSLEPAIGWYSSISQIKTLVPGESVGYNRHFVAREVTRVAIIPVGYADGFRRSLGRGNGGVYIRGEWCPTLGNVCMDMIMVDVTHLDVQEGETAEIIGTHQTIGDFAGRLGTIPYEVMTSFSSRVHRMYIEH